MMHKLLQNWKLISFIVLFELIQIIILIVLLKSKTQFNVTPIKSQTVKTNPQSKLKHFYEPLADKNLTDSPVFSTKVTYSINNDSLNDRYNYSIQKKSDVFRIITLGDSFTYGLYNNTSENWTELLEISLNNKKYCKSNKKFEVINLGVQGYDIQYSMERFRLRGKKYDPDLVVWLLNDSDFQAINEFIRENNSQFKSKNKNVKFPVINPSNRNEFMILLNKVLGNDVVLNKQKSFLYEIDSYFNKSLIIMSVMDLDTNHINIINDFVKKENHYYFATRNLLKINKATFSPDDIHPTKLGQSIISEDLFSYLIKNKLVPCN